MPIDYTKGLLYTVSPSDDPETILFVGYTTQPLLKRMQAYRRPQTCPTRPLFEHIQALGGFEKIHFAILEYPGFNNKMAYYRRVADYIEQLSPLYFIDR
jgi:hypothetical protein